MIHEPFDQSGQRLIVVSLIDNSGPRPFGTSRTRQSFYTHCVGSYSHMLYAYHKIMSIILIIQFSYLLIQVCTHAYSIL